MITGILHQGSGLGNQLHRYVGVRCLAEDKGYDFGMIYNPDGSGKDEGFKGRTFMNLDFGKPSTGWTKTFTEKKVLENGVDIRCYDPEYNFIEDDTLVDGEFQDERYWNHRLDDVREWLKVEPIPMRSNVCAIGFRGGEYTIFPDLFLTKEYWDNAIKLMKEWNPSMEFEVHTDDVVTARKFFPDYPVIHDIGINWRSIRHAKYLILSNSSFFIFPSLLGDAEKIIAPRYWARRSAANPVWAQPQNYYKRYFYI